jgi:hypothetical protein
MPPLYTIQPSYDTSIYLGNTVAEIDRIKEMLNKLSESALAEVGDFVAFLLEKEKKRKALVERVSKAEQEPSVTFESPEDAMQAILNATED